MKTPGLASLAKSFWKYEKSNGAYETGRCDVIIFSKNAIQNNATKQYLQIDSNLASLLEWSHNAANKCKILQFSNHSSLMLKHSIENIAYHIYSIASRSWL